MARAVNSFAALDGEEDDDVSELLLKVAQKVEISSRPSTAEETQPSATENGRADNGQRREGRGTGKKSGNAVEYIEGNQSNGYQNQGRNNGYGRGNGYRWDNGYQRDNEKAGEYQQGYGQAAGNYRGGYGQAEGNYRGGYGQAEGNYRGGYGRGYSGIGDNWQGQGRRRGYGGQGGCGYYQWRPRRNDENVGSSDTKEVNDKKEENDEANKTSDTKKGNENTEQTNNGDNSTGIIDGIVTTDVSKSRKSVRGKRQKHLEDMTNEEWEAYLNNMTDEEWEAYQKKRDEEREAYRKKRAEVAAEERKKMTLQQYEEVVLAAKRTALLEVIKKDENVTIDEEKKDKLNSGMDKLKRKKDEKVQKNSGTNENNLKEKDKDGKVRFKAVSIGEFLRPDKSKLLGADKFKRAGGQRGRYSRTVEEKETEYNPKVWPDLMVHKKETKSKEDAAS